MGVKLTKTSLDFLKDLSKNNDRNWFAENKPRYEKAYAEFKEFMAAVELGMQKVDEVEKVKVHRVYRDVRFSKDKSPYKNNFSGGFARSGKFRRGGYFFSFQQDAHFVGGGFWSPESKDLRFIRDGIIREEEEYRKLLASTEVSDFFGGLAGAELKTAPRGYDKEGSAVDLIRKKQFLLTKSYDNKTVLGSDFKDILVDSFKNMIPYFNFMTDILVHDENGIER